MVSTPLDPYLTDPGHVIVHGLPLAAARKDGGGATATASSTAWTSAANVSGSLFRNSIVGVARAPSSASRWQKWISHGSDTCITASQTRDKALDHQGPGKTVGGATSTSWTYMCAILSALRWMISFARSAADDADSPPQARVTCAGLRSSHWTVGVMTVPSCRVPPWCLAQLRCTSAARALSCRVLSRPVPEPAVLD